jgi:septum site-determining protein MinD
MHMTRCETARPLQEMLGIPLLGAIPEDQQVIISTNRGEPLVLQKKLSLSGIAFENAARRLIGKQDYFIDLNTPYKVWTDMSEQQRRMPVPPVLSRSC